MLHLHWFYVNITVTKIILTSLNVDKNHFLNEAENSVHLLKRTEILWEAKKLKKQNTDYLTIKFYIWKNVQKFENLRVSEGPNQRKKFYIWKKGPQFWEFTHKKGPIFLEFTRKKGPHFWQLTRKILHLKERSKILRIYALKRLKKLTINEKIFTTEKRSKILRIYV